VEDYIEESTKDSSWEYSFLLTTEMLNILQGLGFAREDVEKKWQNWMKDLSLWSLAPQNEATHQVGNEQHQRMIDFEVTALNYRPGDRAENSCIVQPDPAPMDRMALFQWVDHAAILLTVFFGEDCPLVTSRLCPLEKVLQSRKHFHNYTTTHWVALTWRIHLKVKAFFEEKGVGMAAVSAIRRTTVDIGSGMRYREDILPLDFPKPHATKHQGRDSTPTGGNRAPRPDGAPLVPKKQPKPKERVAAQGAAMSARFCPLVNQAAASVTRFHANMLWKTSEAINQMLGTKFIELLPPNNSACLQYHIFGACATPNCRFAHELTAEPSNKVVNGIHARVKARVEEFVVDPNWESALPLTNQPSTKLTFNQTTKSRFRETPVKLGGDLGDLEPGYQAPEEIQYPRNNAKWRCNE
jgi:hypothetical protein